MWSQESWWRFCSPDRALPFTLEGRAAIVTGGSRGLGQAIAGAFLAAGASVLVAARERSRLEIARAELATLVRPGRHLRAVCADVSTPEGCAAVMEGAADLLPEAPPVSAPLGPTML